MRARSATLAALPQAVQRPRIAVPLRVAFTRAAMGPQPLSMATVWPVPSASISIASRASSTPVNSGVDPAGSR